jgi:hypothetical protein
VKSPFAALLFEAPMASVPARSREDAIDRAVESSCLIEAYG